MSVASQWRYYTDSDGDGWMADMYCLRLAARQELSKLRIANGVKVYPCTFCILQGSLKCQKYNHKACQTNHDKESIIDLHCEMCYSERRAYLSSNNVHAKKIDVFCVSSL